MQNKVREKWDEVLLPKLLDASYASACLDVHAQLPQGDQVRLDSWIGFLEFRPNRLEIFVSRSARTIAACPIYGRLACDSSAWDATFLPANGGG